MPARHPPFPALLDLSPPPLQVRMTHAESVLCPALDPPTRLRCSSISVSCWMQCELQLPSCRTGHHVAPPALILQQVLLLGQCNTKTGSPLLCRRHHCQQRRPEPAWRQDGRCCRARQPDSHLELHVGPPILISLPGAVTAAGPAQQPPGTRRRPQDAAGLRCAALSGAAYWCLTRTYAEGAYAAYCRPAAAARSWWPVTRPALQHEGMFHGFLTPCDLMSVSTAS